MLYLIECFEGSYMNSQYQKNAATSTVIDNSGLESDVKVEPIRMVGLGLYFE